MTDSKKSSKLVKTSNPANSSATAVDGYTNGWMSGDLEAAKAHLDPKVTFEDPMNRFTTADQLIEALAMFRTNFKSATVISEVYDGDAAALLYDCSVNTPIGLLRCAEYFKTKNGKIVSIKLVYDATEINKLMGK